MCRYDYYDGNAFTYYYGALFEEGKKVWLFNPLSANALLLYDFGANVGDVFELGLHGVQYTTPQEETTTCRITDKRTVDYHGRQSTCIFINTGESPDASVRYNQYWVEGIGTKQGPLRNQSTDGFGNSYRLLKCMVNDEVIYELGNFPDALFEREEDVRNNADITPQPFIAKGKQWVVGEQRKNSNHYNAIKTYYFGGDTIINSRACSKMLCYTEPEGGQTAHTQLVASVYEENRQVWVYAPGETEARLIYDFGHFRHDTLTVQGGSTQYDLGQQLTFTIGTASAFQHAGTRYRTFDVVASNILNEGYEVVRWTEGIGGWSAPLRNYCLNPEAPYEFLLRVDIGDETIFLDDAKLTTAYEHIREGLHYLRPSDDYYRPFIEEGKVWEVWNGEQPGDYITFRFDGDTIVAGRKCQRLMEHTIHQTDGTSQTRLIAPMYEEEKKVWFFVAGQTEPRLLFDFGAQMGDSVALANPEPKEWAGKGSTMQHLEKYRLYGLVLGHFTLEKQGDIVQHRHWYSLENDVATLSNTSYYAGYWLPGIGSDRGPTYNHPNTRYPGKLVRCTVGDEVLYFDKELDASMDAAPAYHPFIEEGKEWVVGQPAGDQVMNLERYYFDGDTIVAGQPAKRWMCEKTEESGTQTSYIGALYEEGRRVYIALPNKEAVTPGSLSNTWYLRGYSSGGKYIPVGAGKGDGRWLISINEEEQKMEGRSGPNEMIANVSVDGTLIRITDLYSTQVGDMNPISDLFTARLSSVASFSISEDGSLRLSDESGDYLELVTTPIYLLYDFAAGVGDTVEMYDHLSLQNTTCVIKERETVSSDHYKGVRTDVAMYDYGLRGTTLPGEEDYFYYGCWFEGIGSYRRPITNSDYLDGYLCNLLVCKVGDEIIYHDPDWSPVGLDTEVKKQWLDFTHTVKSRPKGPQRTESCLSSDPCLTPSPSPVGEGSNAGEGNLTGEYSDAELLVSLVPLKGPYTVTLTNGSGEEVYAKTVQTSSVVALNTDLSRYPDGPYTLVVENADEAYTAQLNIGEGNGIKGIGQSDKLQLGKAPSSILLPQSSTYYDLSGRRLSAPPAKGLYIQDGKIRTLFPLPR